MNISVPKIDLLAGIQCYCTHVNGIGGLIKQDNTSFRVNEIVDEFFLAGLSPTRDDDHRFPVYILDKKNIDSNHALFEIKKEYGINLKIMGIKDSKAVTKQYASSEQIRNVPKEVKTTHTLLRLKGFNRCKIFRYC